MDSEASASGEPGRGEATAHKVASPSRPARSSDGAAGQGMAATPAPAITATVPSGESFVFARWEEITAEDAPWWTRPTGVGVRLRLVELIDLAAAKRTGTIAKHAISRLITEAQRTVCGAEGYCARRYRPAVDAMRRLLRDDAADTWVPEGAGPSTVAAARDLIDTAAYLPQLVEDIAADAAVIAKMDRGAALVAFTKLETLVELLDAELAHEEHSLIWRRRVVQEAKALHDGGLGLKESIFSSLKAQRHGDRRKFDVLVPLRGLDDPEEGRIGLAVLEQALVISDIIDPWVASNAIDIVGHDEFKDASGILRFEPTAADVNAAGQIVSRELERQLAVWRLRGGRVKEPEAAFIFDRATSEVEIVSLPAEPLALMPNLRGYEASKARDNYEATAVDDAVLQLAFARTAPPATALVNLWTAAEALFSGVVGDVRSEAGRVMAELGELLYVRDLFAWLDTRYTAVGLPSPLANGSSRSGLERTLENSTDKLNLLCGSGDVLAWWRLKSVLQWGEGATFGRQMTAFGERFEQVAARAYLIRNVAVHSAKEREIALAVTLPAFAGLVRECVGYVANNWEAEGTLKVAKSGAFRLQHAALQIEEKAVKGEDAIRALLPSNEVFVVQEDLPASPQSDREGAGIASPPSEPVPVENWVEPNPLEATTGDEPADSGDPAPGIL